MSAIFETPAQSQAPDDRVRHLGNTPGRYFFDKWSRRQERKVSAFACRIQRISPVSMTLAAPVAGELNDTVTSYSETFGLLRGHVVRLLGFGFVLTLDLSPEEREKLAAKVRWAEKHRNYQVSDQRRHKRMLPRNPESGLMLQDGSSLPCFVIDMSPSGAAVSADMAPELGTVLALGKVVGRVVRTLEVGFAIQFIRPVAMEALEAELIRPLRDEQICV